MAGSIFIQARELGKEHPKAAAAVVATTGALVMYSSTTMQWVVSTSLAATWLGLKVQSVTFASFAALALYADWQFPRAEKEPLRDWQCVKIVSAMSIVPFTGMVREIGHLFHCGRQLIQKTPLQQVFQDLKGETRGEVNRCKMAARIVLAALKDPCDAEQQLQRFDRMYTPPDSKQTYEILTPFQTLAAAVQGKVPLASLFHIAPPGLGTPVKGVSSPFPPSPHKRRVDVKRGEGDESSSVAGESGDPTLPVTPEGADISERQKVE